VTCLARLPDEGIAPPYCPANPINVPETMALATRCPHCHTVFKLVVDQLRLKRGLVRCGHCREVFDGALYRIEPPDAPNAVDAGQFAAPDAWSPEALPGVPEHAGQSAPAAMPVTQAAGSDATPVSPAGAAPTADFPDVELDDYDAAALLEEAEKVLSPQTDTTAAAPSPDAEPGAAAEAAPMFESSFEATAGPQDEAEPQPAPATAPLPEPESLATPAPTPRPAEPATSAVPLSATPRALVAMPGMLFEQPSPPVAAARSPMPATAPPPSLAEPAGPAATPPAATGHEANAAPEAAASAAPAPQARAGTATPSMPARKTPPPPPPVAAARAPDMSAQTPASARVQPMEPRIAPGWQPWSPPEDESAVGERPRTAPESAPQARPDDPGIRRLRRPPLPAIPALSRASRAAMPAGIAALAVLLLLQLAWWQREPLAVAWPASARLLNGICALAGCKMTPPRDIDALQIEAATLQQIDSPANLRLSLTLQNRANTVLAFPALEVTLLDAASRVAIRRVVWPQDYLPAGTAPSLGLAAHAAQPVRVQLQTSGAQAANYRVLIFHP
jgi:predicted Zn finger-like uncharacterized protein